MKLVQKKLYEVFGKSLKDVSRDTTVSAIIRKIDTDTDKILFETVNDHHTVFSLTVKEAIAGIIDDSQNSLKVEAHLLAGGSVSGEFLKSN